MPSESNIKLVRDWVQRVWNDFDLDSLSQFHPASFQNHGHTSTIEETKQWHQRMRVTYPDLHYIIDDILAADDKVAFRWTATATQQGTLWGLIPATNKRVTWSGMHMLRIVNSRIVEVWAVADTVAVLQQLEVRLQPPTN
jgi:predicted ester cyclase